MVAAARRPAIEQDAPGGRQLEAGDHPQGRRLARSGRPEHREELAFGRSQGRCRPRPRPLRRPCVRSPTGRRPAHPKARPWPPVVRTGIRSLRGGRDGVHAAPRGQVGRRNCAASSRRVSSRWADRAALPWPRRPDREIPSSLMPGDSMTRSLAARAAPAAAARHPRGDARPGRRCWRVCATSPPPSSAAEQAGTAEAPREINVIMRDYLFEPDPIVLHRGETVRFNVINAGLLAHEFVLGDAAVQAAWATAERRHATRLHGHAAAGQPAARRWRVAHLPGLGRLRERALRRPQGRGTGAGLPDPRPHRAGHDRDHHPRRRRRPIARRDERRATLPPRGSRGRVRDYKEKRTA